MKKIVSTLVSSTPAQPVALSNLELAVIDGGVDQEDLPPPGSGNLISKMWGEKFGTLAPNTYKQPTTFDYLKSQLLAPQQSQQPAK
jgi:hypothetical protein